MTHYLKWILAGVAVTVFSLVNPIVSPVAALTVKPALVDPDIGNLQVEQARHGGRSSFRRMGGGGRSFSSGGSRSYGSHGIRRGGYSAGRGTRFEGQGLRPRGYSGSSQKRFEGQRGPRGGYTAGNRPRYDGSNRNKHYDNRHYDRKHHGERYRNRNDKYRHYHDGYWYAFPWWLYYVAPYGRYYGGYYGDYDGGYYGDYEADPVYGDSAHVQWCLRRYRSYNVATDTFRGYDGYDHRCVRPYAN